MHLDERRRMSRKRIDVKQAAHILGISTDAVHKRVKRGTLGSDKDPDGRVFVYLDDALDNGYTPLYDGYTQPDNVYIPPEAHDELLKELRDRIHYLEEESRRKESIILTLAQRVPELEAAPERRDRPETSTKETVGDRGQDDTGRPSLWRRLFGIPQT